MRYSYSSLYHIRGLSPASPPTDEEMFADAEQHGRAVLTSDPGQLGEQLDSSTALATMLLTGLIGGDKESGTVDERLARQVQRLRDERANKFPSGVFLFFEASGRCTSITPQVEHDYGSFVLALDGLPKREIRNRHEPLVRKILAAIGLGLASVAGFKKISDATVFFTDEGKPVYGFNFEGGIPEMLVSRRPSAEDLAATRQLVEKIAKDNALERVIRLLNESLEPDQGKLRKFLSAWMALEVFVNKSFGMYAERFWDGFSADVSAPIRERYLKRIHKVMRDKYKLLDKFVIISAELDPAEADTDIEIFQCGKKLRDQFSHGEVVDENALLVADVQGLVRKFLRLHVGRT
jgi:hypothetical protein